MRRRDKDSVVGEANSANSRSDVLGHVAPQIQEPRRRRIPDDAAQPEDGSRCSNRRLFAPRAIGLQEEHPIYADDTNYSTSTAISTSLDVAVDPAIPATATNLDGPARSHADAEGVNDPVLVRRHTGGDGRWEAIRAEDARENPLSLGHFTLLKRLGYGDIGSMYLVELRGAAAGGGALFAMKVMDNGSLVSRNKLARAHTEREILGLLDHPFLPTLYSHFETDKFF